MTYSFSSNPPGGAIDVQLHYDHLSRTAHACSTVFDGVLPSRYPSPEAAVDAARELISTTISDGRRDTPPRKIRIWLR